MPQFAGDEQVSALQQRRGRFLRLPRRAPITSPFNGFPSGQNGRLASVGDVSACRAPHARPSATMALHRMFLFSSSFKAPTPVLDGFHICAYPVASVSQVPSAVRIRTGTAAAWRESRIAREYWSWSKRTNMKKGVEPCCQRQSK